MWRGSAACWLTACVLVMVAPLCSVAFGIAAFTPSFCSSRGTSSLGSSLAISQSSSALLGTSLFSCTSERLSFRRPTVNGALGASMMFDQLSSSLDSALKRLSGKKTITDDNIATALKDVRRSLLEADVNLAVTNDVIEKIRAKALGMSVVEGVTPAQQFVKVMQDELTRILGGEMAPLARNEKGITTILLAGLQGTGKTTAAAKLALYCQSQTPPRKVLLVACDIYRPAAIEQLETLAAQINATVFQKGRDENPRMIAREGIAFAKENGFDTVIVDTAGRQVVDDNLMKELKDIKFVVQPDEVLLVVDSMTGQEAANLTKAFNDAVGITGAVLTKLDGDTRGGAALSVQSVSGRPIKFVGVGEKVEALEPFYPDRMASRILGMGDVVSFVEKAQKVVDEAEAKRMAEKMMAATFNFDDFLKQAQMVKQMGSIGGMLKMMPGGGGVNAKQLSAAEERMKVAESLIYSMTKKERADPELLISHITSNSRLKRISKGAGRTVRQAEELIADFQRMKLMMKNMSKMAMQAAGSGGAMPQPNAQMNPNEAFGNRASRRSGTKAAKKARPPAKGFGSK